MRTNLPLLERIARGLEPLLPQLVFVGGATTELFFTAPTASGRDADVICEVTGHVEYFRLGERLRDLGFREDTSPPMFIATKLAAFEGRGGGDTMRSHDIEDIFAVVAYCEELLGEVANEPESVRQWIREHVSASLVAHPDAENAVAGSLPGAGMAPGLIPRVLERLRVLAGNGAS